MNIESSHKFNRSGDTAFGCIEGVNLEVYQVGVIKATQITVTMISQTGNAGFMWVMIYLRVHK